MVTKATLSPSQEIFPLSEQRLYEALVHQSRASHFYTCGAVSDTVDGRFDWLVCHVALLLIRFQTLDSPAASVPQQRLYDIFVADMERWSREAGAGDLSVGQQVKACVAAFQGRLFAYHEALMRQDISLLKEAIIRNMYRGIPPQAELVDAVVAYIFEAFQKLFHQSLEEIQQEELSWPAFPCLLTKTVINPKQN